MLNPYMTLGIEQDCSNEEVEIAHEWMMKKCSTFKGQDGYDELINNINESREMLLDNAERVNYDNHVGCRDGVKNGVEL